MEYIIKLNLPEEYQIKNDILNNLKYDVSKIEGSYTYDIAAAHSKRIKSVYDKLEELFPELFPWSCTKEPYLSLHLKTFGLVRREAVKAKGKVTITGKVGAILNVGIIVISRLGTKYKTIESGIIGSDGTVTLAIECLQPGVIGNCGIGDIVSFEIANTDVYTVTNKNKIENGVDIETIKMAKERIHEKVSKPAHSGNKNNYILWAKSIGGVGKVKVWGAGEKAGVNPGQVEVMVSDYNHNTASVELIQEVQNYINTMKIVNADVKVNSFKAKNVVISGQLKHSSTKSLEQIKKDFTTLIKQKLTEESFVLDNILSIFKVANLLFQVEGVIDYQNFTMNGSTVSIQLAQDEITMITGVELTEWI